MKSDESNTESEAESLEKPGEVPEQEAAESVSAEPKITSEEESGQAEQADAEPEKDDQVTKAEAASEPAEKTEPEKKEEDQEPAEEDAEEEPDEGVELSAEPLAEYEHDDPLAPAYDLERGAPLDRHEEVGGRRLPWRADISSAKEFFNTELLYRFDILEIEERTEIAGRYRLELKGYQGGVWTIGIGNDLEVVNRKEDADLVLTMQQRDFLQLVNGELNAQLAILAQKIKITGDVRKAILFQRLLVPSTE